MRADKTAFLAFAAVLCLVSSAAAQSSCSGSQHYDGGHNQKQNVYHGPDHRYASQHGCGYRYRTPYVEGYLRGTADLVRARAQANLLNAQAWTQAEEARARSLDNSVLALNTRQERKRINNVSRFAQLHEKAAHRKAAQAQFVSTAINHGIDPSQPARLTPQELDPATGQLQWPLLLQTQHFARARGPVDKLFVTRAKFGQIHPDDYIPFRNWVEKIKTELQLSIESLPKQDIAVSQDFLRRMIVEARLPAATVPSATQLVSQQ